MEQRVRDACIAFLEKYGFDFEILNLHFYGGEPFANFEAMRELTERLQAAGDRMHTRVAFSVTTNGTLIDRSKAEFLDRFGYSVLVSCDGDKNIHDRMRIAKDGGPTSAKVYETIELLKSFGNIKLGLSAVIHRFNRLSDACGF